MVVEFVIACIDESRLCAGGNDGTMTCPDVALETHAREHALLRLPTFIIDHIDQIIVAWRDAAPASTSPLESQAKQLLMSVAADIESGASQSTSSTAVTVRAALRGAPDFDLQQVGAALRLLRTVLSNAWKACEAAGCDELQRLNETLDFALSEAIAQHTLQVERTRSLLLGMLGHDLRTPLTAIKMTCQYLTRPDAAPEGKLEAVARVSRCAATMDGMIRDVLDFARSRLGKNMTVIAGQIDAGDVCRDAIDDVRAEHPRCDFRLDAPGKLDATAEAARLRQALRNLLDSAARIGARGMPIRLTANHAGDGLVFRVRCEGGVLSQDTLRTIFDPIAQLAIAGANADGNPPADLGLELFIAREIMRAHGGDVAVTSSEAGETVFEAKLPGH
jgi:signal transduction histidine kinase